MTSKGKFFMSKRDWGKEKGESGVCLRKTKKRRGNFVRSLRTLVKYVTLIFRVLNYSLY